MMPSEYIYRRDRFDRYVPRRCGGDGFSQASRLRNLYPAINHKPAHFLTFGANLAYPFEHSSLFVKGILSCDLWNRSSGSRIRKWRISPALVMESKRY